MTPHFPRAVPAMQRTRPKLPVSAPAVTPPATSQETLALPPFVLYAGRLMLWLTFGMVAEFLVFVIHTSFYILFIVSPPAFIAVIVSGGVGRTLRNRAALYWLLFFACMIVATPFSSWPGGSFERVIEYSKYSLPLLFLVGGLAVNWKEVRALFYVIGCAGIVNLLFTREFGSIDNDGRVSLDASGSSIGNSNDLASHLILVLPFVLFIAMDPKTKPFVKYPLLGAVLYGGWTVFGTASRGALIAAGVMFLFILWRASAFQRLGVLIAGVVLAIALPLLLPGATVLRLASLFGGQHEEAHESEESRSYLFHQSLLYTIQHPIFGVGPDQFSNFEGATSRKQGELGEWHATHCAFSQVSSECGVPALIFFLMGIGSALLTVNRTWVRAKKNGFPEISRTCFCYLVAMVGYLTDITFLANAYRYYLPAMIGLAIVIGAAGNRHMDENPPLKHALAP